jgi:hypothetical protein
VHDHRKRLYGANAWREVEFDTGFDVVFGDTFVPDAQGGSQFDSSEM